MKLAMVEASQTESEVCGAKLRDGSLCKTSLAVGSRRCFKHGGAPRSGAPGGNSNAFKHGAWADYDSERPQMSDFIAAEKLMTSVAMKELYEPTAVEFVSLEQQGRGRAIANELQLLTAELDRVLRHAGREDRKIFVARLARRDALRILLARASSFESEAAFRRGVSVIFHARLKARAKFRTDVPVERAVYSRAWASYCTELWLWGWPEAAFQPHTERLTARERATLRRKFIRTAQACKDMVSDAKFANLVERYEDSLWGLRAGWLKP